jgi:TonB family protein
MANSGAIPQALPKVPGENSGPASGVATLPTHLQTLADKILLLAAGEGVAIALAEPGGLRCRATSGIAPPVGARIDARSGLTGACLSTGTLLRCDDSEEDQRVDRQVCRALGIRAMVCVPVAAGQEVVGIFEVFSSRPNAFADVDVSGLRAKADEIAACFAAEEALAQAAVGSAADLGAAGNLAPSWTPAPSSARRSVRLRLSSRTWQAVLGALVLALGLFLLLRAIRASGPAASAWITPQPASAAPTDPALPPAVTDRLSRPRPPQPQTRARSTTAAPQQRPGPRTPAISVPAATSNSSATLPQVPPNALIAAENSGGSPISELVGSVSATQPSLPEDLRVSSGIPQPVLMRRVEPDYPALARQSRIEGEVVLEARVDKAGYVTGLRVERGNSLLAAAAMHAVQKWRYRPSRLNGEPIEVPIRITLKFVLSK